MLIFKRFWCNIEVLGSSLPSRHVNTIGKVQVAHIHGKDEVTSSNLVRGSIFIRLDIIICNCL